MSSAVNRPTDVKAKQADVDRKLQFYGILTGKSSRPQAQSTAALTHPVRLQPSRMARFHP